MHLTTTLRDSSNSPDPFIFSACTHTHCSKVVITESLSRAARGGWPEVADESACLGIVMPIYVLVAAEGQPELWDAPLAEHLKDDSLVDDGASTTVLRVVQPPRVAFRYVLAEVVVVRPAGGRESQQQLLKQTTMTVVSQVKFRS